MENEFNYFYDFVYRELNLNLNSYKDAQMQRRILSIMKKSGAKDMIEYSKLISKDEKIRKEFLDQVTINVTEFFRNKDMFEQLEKIIVNTTSKKFNKLKIWSAACSNGAEPYSIAIMLDRNNLLNKAEIIATDIDKEVLSKARDGKYKETELKGLDNNLLNKYFAKDLEHYRISENLRKKVNFKRHDLLLDKYERDCHLIVCRNVTIYFKQDVKDEVYRKFSESLVSGGILFIGATEGIYNPKEFGLMKVATCIYEKM
ncbi:protein-glutamate O-methyltransferase CheR [Soehngenia longivitae]|uniref:protein-glutamate O-methyltransferase n=1 Tax=Soehngenia longivitae TaxID=2562294 RepID=A0A4Z0D2X8_9FIRM|nr:protein-glutamate O-methyltransferase CheR [Soehngenia longivitae]TFZ39897.1 protein-glutamate O-methyltransferase CheR [Soehngenia longivitae]